MKKEIYETPAIEDLDTSLFVAQAAVVQEGSQVNDNDSL